MGDCTFKFHDDEMFTWVWYAESYRMVSLRIIVERVLTPVRYKNHTEIYCSNVQKKPIWYKTCDDAVGTTHMFS